MALMHGLGRIVTRPKAGRGVLTGLCNAIAEQLSSASIQDRTAFSSGRISPTTNPSSTMHDGPSPVSLSPFSSPASPPGEAVGMGEPQRTEPSEEPSSSSFRAPPFRLDTVSPLVKDCEYAVRGAIVTRALQLEQQLLKGQPLPFPSVLYCNIGNPQALGQPPVTFFREVLALCDHPGLIEPAKAALQSGVAEGLGFSTTSISRAERILHSLPAQALGAYSHSKGIPLCRSDVAKGIEARDEGHVADPESIFLTDGASPAAQMMMRLLVRRRTDGVLCPIPQYPLYSASLALLGGTLLPYYLEEEEESRSWRLSSTELERSLSAAVSQGVTPRALVVINPGNPTGQVLGLPEQQGIVRFCVKHNLVLLADEVYQENVYAADRKFTSFKKVARDMGVGPAELALVSFHSASKGFYGECGRRGGYLEATGIPEEVMEQLYKLASITLCGNVGGQVMMSLLMRPPQEGDDAFPLFQREKDEILSSLSRKAKVLVERLNSEPGVTCCHTEGAMYAFPRIHLPPRAVEAASANVVPADAFYAQKLLEGTGIVVVPGSGFGQREGTWHLRFTILPKEEDIPGMMDRFSKFHKEFLKQYS